MGRAIQELEILLGPADDLRRLFEPGSGISAGQKPVVGAGVSLLQRPDKRPLDDGAVAHLYPDNIRGGHRDFMHGNRGSVQVSRLRARSCPRPTQYRFPNPIQSVRGPTMRLARSERLESFI